MYKNPDIHKSAKGFDKNPENINRNGRPKRTLSIVNEQLEAEGYSCASIDDITSCYLRLINIDVPTLKEMIVDNEQPSLVRIVGKSIISGKGFDVIETMLNRAIGKATSNIDLKTGGEKINTTSHTITFE